MTGKPTKWISALALTGALAAAATGAAQGSVGPANGCLAASGGGRGENLCIGALPVSHFRIALGSRNGSRVRGVAEIEFGLHETRVLIRVSGAPAGVVQAVHLHAGTCGRKGKLLASLGRLRSGRRAVSVDPLPVSAGRYAIDIHETTAAGAAVVACGSVPSHR
jgi:hypothetical protein